jgi:hypothetical protein
LELLLPEQATVLDEDDARVKLPCSCELHEVIDVRRDEDAVLRECRFEDRMVERAEQATVAYVNGVNAILFAKGLRDPR